MEAYNDGDIDAVLELFSADVEVYSPLGRAGRRLRLRDRR